ncbi:hypothetical protein TruAng_003922 [Truncatella angustata]|nr:hypothetical protein TruAng_003922 [Truncatella angustata]
MLGITWIIIRMDFHTHWYLKMPAINTALVAREAFGAIAKREQSWPAREAGVMVVFCIVFVVAVGLIGLFIHKKLAARKASKQGA